MRHKSRIQHEVSMKGRAVIFKRINKIDKPLAILMKQKREKTKINWI